MSQPRAEHHGAAVGPGEVLVFGGKGLVDPLLSTELYDLNCDRWIECGPLSEHRIRAAAVCLNDGRVLVIGGFGSGTCELFDPIQRSWSYAQRLLQPRWRHTAIALSDGRILVVGGAVGEDVLDSCEIYEPARDEWRTTAPLKQARCDHGTAILHDGSTLVAGGTKAENPNPVLHSSEIFDPKSETWRPGPELHPGRHMPKLAKVVNGSIALFDGLSSPILYDATTNAWIDLPSAPVRRSGGFTASAVQHGRQLVVCGGRNVSGEPVADIDVLDVTRGDWVRAASMEGPRNEHTATLIDDVNRILIIGGYHKVPLPPDSPFAPGKPFQLVRTTRVETKGDSIVAHFRKPKRGRTH